jgi:hypothetical protein
MAKKKRILTAALTAQDVREVVLQRTATWIDDARAIQMLNEISETEIVPAMILEGRMFLFKNMDRTDTFKKIMGGANV